MRVFALFQEVDSDYGGSHEELLNIFAYYETALQVEEHLREYDRRSGKNARFLQGLGWIYVREYYIEEIKVI